MDTLLAHERTRVEEERAAFERRREADANERARRERERAEQQERHAAELRERAEQDERRRLDEEARLEGIRRAEVERVASEARLRGEIELSAQRQSHELRLSATQAIVRMRAFRNALAGTGLVAALALTSALGLEFGLRRPELARLHAEHARALQSERERGAHVQGMLGDSQRLRRELEERLAHSAREAQPPSTASPAAPTARPPALRAPRPGVRGGAVGTARPCRGDPNDPLNPCL